MFDLLRNRWKAFWGLMAQLLPHMRDFSLIWLFLALIAIGVIFSCKWVAYAGLGCILLLLTSPSHPMNAVYGLIGETLKHSWSVPIHQALGCDPYHLFELKPEPNDTLVLATDGRHLYYDPYPLLQTYQRLLSRK